MSTQDACYHLYKTVLRDYPDDEDRIAWLNLANAHHIGGSYSSDPGSQEEFSGTHSNGIALLSLFAATEPPPPTRPWFAKGWNLPPGASVLAKTRWITSPEQVLFDSLIRLSCFACVSMVFGVVHSHQFNSWMIATAFADFRLPVPRLFPYTERDDFADLKGQDPACRTALKRRLKMDMVAVLLTAKRAGLQHLLLAASGCGAFGHDAGGRLSSLLMFLSVSC